MSIETHMLALDLETRARMVEILKRKKFEVGAMVEYKKNSHSIVSIFPVSSPLCGYVLLSSIGHPIRIDKLRTSKI